MKLFQQRFVAVAAVGLIAPTTAQASNVFNIEGIDSYVRKKSTSRKQKLFNSNSFNNELATQKVESSIIKNKAFEAGSFSDTATLDSKVTFAVGAVDGTNQGNATTASYMWQGNLNSSFTGDDNLYIRLKAGNTPGAFNNKDFGTFLSSSK